MSISPAALAEAQRRLSKGRAFCAHKAPYAATTLHGLVPQFLENFPQRTLGVSPGLVLYIGFEWFMEEPTLRGPDGHEYLGGCLYHEVNHIQRGMDRLERLEHKDLANIAADLAINDQMIDAGWKLPPWVQRVGMYKLDKGKTLEWYYNALLKKREKDPSIGKGFIGCGGAAGLPHKAEHELDVLIGRTPLEVENIRYTTNKKIDEHLKSRGTAPGYYSDDLVFERTKPVIPWPRVFNHVVRRVTGQVTAGHRDDTFQRPNRRSIGLGVIRPATFSRSCEVVFFRDTSGSMSVDDLNVANNQMMQVMRQCGIDSVTYCDVDTIMHGKMRRVRTGDIPNLSALGRGGTSFVQALAFIEKAQKKPDVVVYLTDGHGTAPKLPPKKVEVIWCLIPSNGSCVRPAPWGHVVVCSDDPDIRRRVTDQFLDEDSP